MAIHKFEGWEHGPADATHFSTADVRSPWLKVKGAHVFYWRGDRWERYYPDISAKKHLDGALVKNKQEEPYMLTVEDLKQQPAYGQLRAYANWVFPKAPRSAATLLGNLVKAVIRNRNEQHPGKKLRLGLEYDIDSLFTWAATVEGQAYWEKINDFQPMPAGMAQAAPVKAKAKPARVRGIDPAAFGMEVEQPAAVLEPVARPPVIAEQLEADEVRAQREQQAAAEAVAVRDFIEAEKARRAEAKKKAAEEQPKKKVGWW